MQVETELKVRLEREQFEEIRGTLHSEGVPVKAPRQFEINLLFDSEDGRLRREDKMLRLRSYGEKTLLTYKGPLVGGSRLKERPETQIRVDSLEAAETLLAAIGYRAVFRYDKYREKLLWQLAGSTLEVCLDETPIGFFIEVEGPREAVLAAAHHLGLSEDRFIVASYAELYEEAGLGVL